MKAAGSAARARCCPGRGDRRRWRGGGVPGGCGGRCGRVSTGAGRTTGGEAGAAAGCGLASTGSGSSNTGRTTGEGAGPRAGEEVTDHDAVAVCGLLARVLVAGSAAVLLGAGLGAGEGVGGGVGKPSESSASLMLGVRGPGVLVSVSSSSRGPKKRAAAAASSSGAQAAGPAAGTSSGVLESWGAARAALVVPRGRTGARGEEPRDILAMVV